MGNKAAGQLCTCLEKPCQCSGLCLVPATTYVKSTVFEPLCELCADYALGHGAREATPFYVKHPYWSAVLFRIWGWFSVSIALSK
jgi:hypothetical protein